MKYQPSNLAANNSFQAFFFVLDAKINVIVPRMMLTIAEMASKERKSEYIGYEYSRIKSLKILFAFLILYVENEQNSLSRRLCKG